MPIPNGQFARLRAFDQALGVQFRPSTDLAPLAQASEPVTGAVPETLEALQVVAAAAFPGVDSLADASQLVFGEGNPAADLVFVGEAPGAEEDRTGRPFVGAAGQKLDEIITAMGLTRSDVYICNVLKARPPQNRTPLPDEVAAHLPFLQQQLAIIRPAVIVALGGPAAKVLLNTSTGITQLRGRWGFWQGPAGLQIPVMPTFHPAYLLRQYTPEVRGQVWSDMQAVRVRIGLATDNA